MRNEPGFLVEIQATEAGMPAARPPRAHGVATAAASVLRRLFRL
jgi:hypothetical protein